MKNHHMSGRILIFFHKDDEDVVMGDAIRFIIASWSTKYFLCSQPHYAVQPSARLIICNATFRFRYTRYGR